MKIIMRNLLALMLLGGIGGMALADTPPSLKMSDSHSVMAKGKLITYRVQVQGLEFGRDKEELDAEVLVALDSQPGMVFGLRLHEDSPPVNQVIAATLREAYMTNTPVNIYYQIAPGRKYVKIHVVEITR